MKLWYGYGSEHSNNLVMIGHFKSVEDAKETLKQITRLTEELSDKIDLNKPPNRFEEDIHKLLTEEKCYFLEPSELEQFLYETHTKIEDDKVILTTDEFEVSAFMKLMIEKGAKIEIFSAHDYPDAEYGRGK